MTILLSAASRTSSSIESKLSESNNLSCKQTDRDPGCRKMIHNPLSHNALKSLDDHAKNRDRPVITYFTQLSGLGDQTDACLPCIKLKLNICIRVGRILVRAQMSNPRESPSIPIASDLIHSKVLTTSW